MITGIEAEIETIVIEFPEVVKYPYQALGKVLKILIWKFQDGCPALENA